MSRPRNAPKYEVPSKLVRDRIHQNDFTLDELFEDGRDDQGAFLGHKRTYARLRVVQAFKFASAKPNNESVFRRHVRGVANAIFCERESLEDLARLIIDGMHPGSLGSFVKAKDLPREYRNLRDKGANWTGIIVKQAAQKLIIDAVEDLYYGLNDMVDEPTGELYFQEVDTLGEPAWNVRQSVIDELPSLRDEVHRFLHPDDANTSHGKSHKVKRDDRGHGHGMSPKSWKHRKGVRAPGASIGGGY